ncbi:MAG: SEL1-like repeat protein [Alphaproteobacteria bacterium]|nr:SEL1-like repeat protein [Alphaproteobacteria bacterium]
MGLAAAQNELAGMCYRGHGTKKSLKQAFKWISLAYDGRGQCGEEEQREIEAAYQVIASDYSSLAFSRNHRPKGYRTIRHLALVG